MLHVLLLLLLGAADAKAPSRADLPPPGPVGFALCCIASEGVFKGDYEAMQVGYVYGSDRKMIGKYHRGDTFAKPFQDWRVVGFPLRSGKRPSMVVTNVNTKETLELETADLSKPSTRPVKIH